MYYYLTDKLLDTIWNNVTSGSLEGDYMPPCSAAYSTTDGYKVSLTAPGLKTGDFEVTLSGERLYIKIKGKLHASYFVPLHADTTKLEAAYEAGILKVSCPWKSGDAFRKLEVKSA